MILQFPFSQRRGSSFERTPLAKPGVENSRQYKTGVHTDALKVDREKCSETMVFRPQDGRTFLPGVFNSRTGGLERISNFDM